MRSGVSNASLIRRVFRTALDLPVDSYLVVTFTVAAGFVLTMPDVSGAASQLLAGLVLWFFLPGYVLVSILFPADRPADRRRFGAVTARVRDDSVTGPAGLDWVERAALSFGTSLVLVPLFALVLSESPFSLRTVVTGTVVVVVLLGAVAMTVRRMSVPADARYEPSVTQWVADARGYVMRDSIGGTALNVVLIASILVALGSVGFAVAAPRDGTTYTEFALLTETDEGELVASDYPTDLVSGETSELVFEVTNHEAVATNYTVVAGIQRVDATGESTTVTEQTEFDRFDRRVATGDTWRERHVITPETTGEELRLYYYLYRGDAPETVSADSAYRHLHVWVNVSAPAGT